MPITAIVNLNQGTTVQLSNPKTVATVAPLTVGPATSLSSLSQISDVDASSPDNNEVLVYDSATNKYVIKTIPTIQGGTF